MKKSVRSVLIPLLAIALGLLVGSIGILLAKANPIVAYPELFKAAFGCESFSRCNLLVTLQMATPIILTAMAAVVAFRSGLFAIGQGGQMMLGGMMAAWLGYVVHLPPIIHPIVAAMGAMAVGAAYNWIPAVLKIKLQVNETISTIILNKIATLLVTYLISFPLKADQSYTPHSTLIDETARLPPLAPNTKWGIGFFIAVIAVVLVQIYFWRTSGGYEQRMAGQAPLFARFGGIASNRVAMRGMLISGALAGLAGGILALEVHYRMLSGFAGSAGWDGITAAILGQIHPIGTLIVSVLFAGIRQGAQIGLQFALKVPREFGGVLIALIVLFVASDRAIGRVIDAVAGALDRLRKTSSRIKAERS